ncbi:YtxH domain-containing protein [Actinomadura macra]|uniref:YtxH domain-containing protein n=1 Tax=Actinomadura macra TaxID=46164 RepID=UPI00082BF34D|nr:YtxH domain-containing protein [Actinomadura macra]
MKYTFIAGAAIGYVLGTRAGRERYEQLKQWSRQVSENPNVQEATEKLRAKGTEVAGVARDKAGSLSSAAKEKVPQQVQGHSEKADAEQPPVYPG